MGESEIFGHDDEFPGTKKFVDPIAEDKNLSPGCILNGEEEKEIRHYFNVQSMDPMCGTDLEDKLDFSLTELWCLRVDHIELLDAYIELYGRAKKAGVDLECVDKCGEKRKANLA